MLSKSVQTPVQKKISNSAKTPTIHNRPVSSAAKSIKSEKDKLKEENHGIFQRHRLTNATAKKFNAGGGDFGDRTREFIRDVSTPTYAEPRRKSNIAGVPMHTAERAAHRISKKLNNL